MTRFSILWKVWSQEDEGCVLFGSEDSLAFSSLDLSKQAEMIRLTRKGLLGLEYQAIDQKRSRPSLGMR